MVEMSPAVAYYPNQKLAPLEQNTTSYSGSAGNCGAASGTLPIVEVLLLFAIVALLLLIVQHGLPRTR